MLGDGSGGTAGSEGTGTGSTVPTGTRGEDTSTGGPNDDGSSDGSDGSTTGGNMVDPCETGSLAPLNMLGDADDGITSARYEMTFPLGGTGVLYDYCGSGDNLLFTNTASLEHHFGILHYVPPPGGWDIWDGPPPTIAILEDGPAIIRLSFSWGVDASGDSLDEAAGTTFYTFLADGRIVRHENFEILGGVDSSTQDWLVAYLSLDPARVDEVQAMGDVNGTYPITVGDPDIGFLFEAMPGEEVTMCARNTRLGDAVGFTAVPESNNLTEWSGVRASNTATEGPHNVALQADFARGGPGSGGSNDIMPGGYEAYLLTTVGAGPDAGCDRAHALGNEFAEAGALIVGNGTWSGYHRFTAAHLVDVPGPGSTTVSPPAGTALTSTLFDIVDPNGPVVDVTGVELDGRALDEGSEYLVQEGQNGNTWLLVGVAVDSEQTLTITHE